MTRHLNDTSETTSVTDICEIGGDFATMRDVHYVLRGEVKCWNSLIKSTTSGRGSWDNGGNVSSVGHLYGFGNTLDKALTAVVGCKERGRQVDGPLDHSLVARLERDGSKTTRMETDGGQEECGLEMDGLGAQYYDARWVKKAITRLVLVETLGGIAPPKAVPPRVRQGSGGHQQTRTRTVYGAASASASSFVVHHTQQTDLHGGGGGRRRQHQQAGAQDAYQLGQLP